MFATRHHSPALQAALPIAAPFSAFVAMLAIIAAMAPVMMA